MYLPTDFMKRYIQYAAQGWHKIFSQEGETEMGFGVTGILGGDYLAEQYRKNPVAGKSGGVSFAELAAFQDNTDASALNWKPKGADAVSIYGMGVYSRKDISASKDLSLPIETERYKIEDASYIEGVPAYEIRDKEMERGLYIREDQLMIQKDERTGLEFVINMDQPFSCNVLMTEELKGLLDGIAGKRGIDLQEVPMQGGLTVNQDPKTGLRYLSIQGNEAKGMSVVATSKEDLEIIEKLADEFQRYAVSSQRSTAGLYALLEISGNLKRENEGFTYLTPNGITYIPYDGNSGKAWEIEILGSDYSAVRNYLAMGIEASNYQTWLGRFNSARLLDADTVPLNHYSVNGYRNGYCFMQ